MYKQIIGETKSYRIIISDESDINITYKIIWKESKFMDENKKH